MNLRTDKLHTIPIDSFVSASGRWVSIFTESYIPQASHLRGYFIVIIGAGTSTIRMVKLLGFDDRVAAEGKWLGWKQLFGERPLEAVYEDDIPSGFQEFKMSPPYLIEEDSNVLEMIPKGARLFVRAITPVDEWTARAEATEAFTRDKNDKLVSTGKSLVAVVDDQHKPRPTTGIVLAIGEDPLIRELYKVGDLVMYSPHCGTPFRDNGEDYLSLELHEIIGSKRPKQQDSGPLPSLSDSSER